MAAGADQGPVRNQSLATPREFGHAIGDELVLRIRFELVRGYRLDREALPRIGRVTRWLALNRVDVTTGIGWRWVPHTVALTFQVVNAPGAVIGVGTPPQSLRVVGPRDDFPVIVPAWGTTVSPITARQDRPDGAVPELRPARPPPAIDPFPASLRAAVAALGATAVAGLLAYMHLWLPFVARTRGPFARACREIASVRGAARRDGDYAAALAAAHRAFNATAGRVVFEHELERFFDVHRRFRDLRTPIAQMFRDSTGAFYRDGPPAAPDRDGVRDLLALCRACRDRERGLP